MNNYYCKIFLNAPIIIEELSQNISYDQQYKHLSSFAIGIVKITHSLESCYTVFL